MGRQVCAAHALQFVIRNALGVGRWAMGDGRLGIRGSDITLRHKKSQGMALTFLAVFPVPAEV